jgi:hypothetical protein
VSGTGGGAKLPAQPAHVSVALRKGSLKLLRKRKVGATVTTTGPATSCLLTVRMSAAQRRALHLGAAATLGSLTLKPPRLTGTFTITLTSGLGRKLAHARKVSLSVTASCQAPGGAVKATAKTMSFR